MVLYTILCLEGSTPEDGGLSLFIALRWMQNPGGVMVWLTENIQACSRIFRQAQHQWLARDILHQAHGVFIVFVLWHRYGFKRFKGFNSVLSVLEKKRKGDYWTGMSGRRD